MATKIPFLFEAATGAYRVSGQRGTLSIDKHFSGKNARSNYFKS